MGAGGADVAIAAADVALFTNDLGCLPHVVRLGRLTRRKIMQNIGLAVITKVCCLLLRSARLPDLRKVRLLPICSAYRFARVNLSSCHACAGIQAGCVYSTRYMSEATPLSC